MVKDTKQNNLCYFISFSKVKASTQVTEKYKIRAPVPHKKKTTPWHVGVSCQDAELIFILIENNKKLASHLNWMRKIHIWVK